MHFKAFWRTMLFIPTVLSIVQVGFIWRLILSPLWGISADVPTSVSTSATASP